MSLKKVLFFGLISAISVGSYLYSSWNLIGIGFPLDDAWIHQTYARNIALLGEWSFISGQTSAGLTAPLWAFILSIGPALNLGPYIFTFILGWVLLWVLTAVGWRAIDLLIPERPNWAMAGGVLMAVEWHMVWASVSGMETLLFIVLATSLLVRLIHKSQEYTSPSSWLDLGAVVGLAAWVRPEAILFLAPIGFVILFSYSIWWDRIKAGIFSGIGTGLVFTPYILFNRWLANSWLPNTFYAKQAEYSELIEFLPFWKRLLDQFGLPMIGVGFLLLPGFVYLLWQAYHNKKWAVIGVATWIVGHLILYAVRLPVIYQHGRYAMPVMPIYFLMGLAGVAQVIQLNSTELLKRVVSRVWLVSIVLVTVLFWWQGAQAYARDVALINSEMVATALWVADNSEPEDLIAAHDIGALGYFAQRPLLDLAGLVSPEVIPFIRDEVRLESYLKAESPKYLVTFPNWYHQLSKGKILVFQTNGKFSLEMGGENMAVYLLP